MSKLDLFDLINLGATLVKAANEDHQVKEVRKTDEYKEEVQANIENFESIDDCILLKEFHEQYADDWGNGLFNTDVGTRMDPAFEAYMKVFKERRIKKLAVVCEDCGKTIGYRMAPKDYDELSPGLYAVNGYCYCKCGKHKKWEISRDYCGDTDMSVHNIDY